MADLDRGIIALYLALLVVAGILLSRYRTTTADFFLASRKASWPVVGLALVGSNISPGVLIGITGSAYAFGISVYNYDWMATVVLVVFALFFLPAILSSGVFTMPEFLERRYDRRLRVWFSGLTLFLYVMLDQAGALYCGTLVMRLLFPDLSFVGAVAILALLSALYSITGGLRAVLYTQAAQAVVVLGSALVLALFSFAQAGGWSAVMHATPAAALKLILPASDPLMPWTGLVFGAPILAFYFWCTNQVIVQRMLAARTIEDGQKGALLAGLLKLLTLFVIVLPGIAGRMLYPHVGNPDEIYLRLALGCLPAGLLGVLLAAFLGALMAQLSASYNSAATLVAMDFVRKVRPDAGDSAIVGWGRFATVGCMILSALWAPQIVRFPSLWQYFQAVLAYATPPVVALFLAGMLWPRATARGATWAVGAGSSLGFGLFVAAITGVYRLQFLNAAFVVFVFSASVLALASLARPQTAADIAAVAEATFTKSWEQARFGGSAVQRWAVVLLAVTAGIVLWFH